MTRIILIIAVVVLMTSCSRPSPEKYFTSIVLNTNLFYGFAGDGIQRQLISPSVRLVDAKTGATEPEKRSALIKMKIDALEASYGKIKKLPNWSESKEMHTTAIALYDYVLPVYKNEYIKLAEMYDNNASPEQIGQMEKEITDKYATGFESLYDKLITAGKLYAEKFKINVRWDVRTRPS